MHRLFFIHQNYVADSVITLSYDRYLNPKIDHTTIYFGTEDKDHNLLDTYQEFGLSTSHLSVVRDLEIVNPYCAPLKVDIYKFGGWISQQFIKLIALDQCDADCILIQDCDTFALESVNFFEKNLPVLLIVPEPTPASYNEYFHKITNLQGRVNFNFVSEFMPVLKTDWIALRNRIQDVHQCHWIQALFNEFSKDLNKQVWFSEYQLMGLWAFEQHHSLKTITQRRLLLRRQQRSITNGSFYNFACNSRCFSIDDLKNGVFLNY